MKKITAFLFITSFGIAIGFLTEFLIIHLRVFQTGYIYLNEPNTILLIIEIIMLCYGITSLIYLVYYFTKNADRMK